MNLIEIDYIDQKSKYVRLAELLNQPWAQLLDSSGKNLDYNRFDIFCAQPSATLSFDGSVCHIDSTEAMTLQLTDIDLTQPIICLRKILHFYKQQTIQNITQDSLPFHGGWLGFISYDFGRHLEQLPSLAVDDIQLPQVQMGLYQWALISDHKLKTTRLYNFGLPAKSWRKIATKVQDSLSTNHKVKKSEFKLQSSWSSNTSKTEYLDAFEQIQNYILAGDCYQVNFAQRFSAKYSGDSFAAYQQLTEANQAPFSAFLNFDDYQILSLSPERFIESNNRQVITQPIKGTRPRSSNPEKDLALAKELINSEKDRAENLMIVDLLRNDLSRTAAKGTVEVSELFGHYKFESVHHLISTIESKLKDNFDNFDLLATTLPGGSITGAPKIRAMEIIEELEPVRRNLYCGIIGYIDFNEKMDTNICIRTLIAKNHTLYCWAGGGLVADSDANTEYQETFDKLAKIIPILEPDNAHYD